jgi:hypothetical protein
MQHPFAGLVAPAEQSKLVDLDPLELEDTSAGLNKTSRSPALTTGPDSEEGGRPTTSKPQLESGTVLRAART